MMELVYGLSNPMLKVASGSCVILYTEGGEKWGLAKGRGRNCSFSATGNAFIVSVTSQQLLALKISRLSYCSRYSLP